MQKKLIEIRKKQPSTTCVVRCFLITVLFVSFCCQQIWFIVFIYFFLWFIYYKNTSYQSISNTTARHAITTKTFSCGLCNFYKLVSHIPACIVKWKWAIGCFTIRKDLKHFRFLLFQATVYFIEIFFIPVSKTVQFWSSELALLAALCWALITTDTL